MLDKKHEKTVLICCNAYPPNFIGGAELIAHYQAKELQNKGYKVVVFAGETRSITIRHQVKKDEFDGLEVYRIGLTHEDFDYNYVNFKNVASEVAFLDIIEKYNPQVVHFHNIIGLSIKLPQIAKRKGVKTVMTLHDNWGYCFKNTVLKDKDTLCQDHTKCVECMESINHYGQNIPMVIRQDYFKYSLEYIDMFISPSKYLADAYIKAGIPVNKMNNIWNGIDVKRFINIKKIIEKDDKIRFTYVGYFGQHKGVMVLLKALNLLPNKDKVIINLVGDGDQKQVYQEFIKKYHLQNQVKFWGKVPNQQIEKVYAETDVYVLPSIWPENQPVSITEAMTAGIPVITTNMGGSIELVDDNINGYLFEAGEYKQLERIMYKLVEETEKIKRFGQNAQEKMKKYSFDKQVDSIVKVYNKIDFKLNIQSGKRKIAFIGKKIDYKLINNCKTILLKEYDLIMLDWIDELEIKNIDLIICMDDIISIEDIIKSIVNAIPLIVPESNRELLGLVKNFNCGLYYKNEKDLEKEIEYLIINHKERNKIGINGYKLILS